MWLRILAYPKPKTKLRNNSFIQCNTWHGFTLIELMVVITVIAILSGVVVFNVNFNSDKRQVQTVARQLQQLTQVASDEALQLGRLLGVELFTDGYRFLEWVEPNQVDPVSQSTKVSGVNSLSALQVTTTNNSDEGQAGHWGLLKGDKYLKQQRFKKNENLIVELEIADDRIDLLPMDAVNRIKEKKLSDKNKKLVYQPHLIFSPSGEGEDFKLIVYLKNDSQYQYILSGDVLGRLSLTEPGKDKK